MAQKQMSGINIDDPLNSLQRNSNSFFADLKASKFLTKHDVLVFISAKHTYHHSHGRQPQLRQSP